MQFAKGVPLVPFVPLSLLKRIEISIPNKPFLPLITTLSLSYHYPSYRHSIVIRETFDRLSTEIRQRTSGPIPSDERPSSGDVQKGQKGQRDTRDTQNKLPTVTEAVEVIEEPIEEKTVEYLPMEVHYIDVGEADSALVICGDEAMLIDAGNPDQGSEIRLYLKQQGVEKLKYLLLTHSDRDHIGGAASIVSNMDIDNLFMCRYEKDNDVYLNLINEIDYKSMNGTRLGGMSHRVRRGRLGEGYSK